MSTPDDLCPRPRHLPAQPTQPHANPIYLSSVYECDSPQQADALLAGREAGYVYARDGHPNADLLMQTCRDLHGTSRAAITSSGMSALALVVLSQLKPGDHLVVSNQLYGRSLLLLTSEAARWGIDSTVVDPTRLSAVERAMRPQTRLVVVETISNPLLRVVDLQGLSQLAHAAGAALLADNTLAGPTVCRPSEFGADWIVESLTKSMNGHSDVVLGLLCGPEERWERVPSVLSTWGLASAPFDCWLAQRGLATLAVRAERACTNALAVAHDLTTAPAVAEVHYPGLDSNSNHEHPDHELAVRQFGQQFGSIVTFTLHGGGPAAERFIHAAHATIPFCPSLGELNTTLSHPESTSHRGLTAAARAVLGISGGTIRLSVGIESPETIRAALRQALAASV